ncbi:MAG: YihY/virulence factor BrkB family protein [Flavobacteriaceae bacterium]|nr:YihY/virulence factor BrkB family protein [Flavobacteriaceae bacterium]
METKEKLLKIPILKFFIKLADKIKVPGLHGMSLYDLLDMYVIGIVKGAVTSRAGSVAFSFFMALFPFVLFVLTLIPFIPIANFQQDFMYFIEQILPPKTTDSTDVVIKDIANNANGGLLSSVFVLSLFLMTNGINALFSGFEYTYHKIITRTIIRQYIVALFTSVIMALLLLLTVAVIIYFEIAVDKLKNRGFVNDAIFWIEIGKYLILIFTLFVGVSILYFFGTREGKKVHFFSPGSILTTILIILNFKLFGLYVSKFVKYNELYGIIGTVLIIMLFIWLNSIILLLGFELNTCMIGLRKKMNKL